MAEWKTLKDLEGWTPGIEMKSPFGRPYRIYFSPDGTQLASVDLSDDEVVFIWNKNLKKLIYIHPVTRRGMDRVGMTSEQLNEVMRSLGDSAGKIWPPRC